MLLLLLLLLLLLRYIFSTKERKYSLNALAIARGLLVNFPSIFSTCTSSLIVFFPDSTFAISQVVLILLFDYKIWLL
jgi:hypothetical protein